MCLDTFIVICGTFFHLQLSVNTFPIGRKPDSWKAQLNTGPQWAQNNRAHPNLEQLNNEKMRT